MQTNIQLTDDQSQDLLERFIRYAKMNTQSNASKADNGRFPSTENQKEFARFLVQEMKNMGIPDVELDKNFYVIGRLDASEGFEHLPSFGLCAHYDVASDAPAENVNPIVHPHYDGACIQLKDGFVLDPSSDLELASCTGHTIITSDGTTLLGADNKAGIASILSFAAYLLEHPEITHGPIELLFTPDEETGHGMDHVPLKKIRSKAFYTVDGGEQGEIQTECFNAWKSEIEFTGIAAHLGDARGKMVNAVSMAAAFVEMLPAQESPEATDGYYGYFCPLHIEGSVEKSHVTVFLRDFDAQNMEDRLTRLDSIARAVEARFAGGKVILKNTCQYKNMKEKLDAAPDVVEKLEAAVRLTGIEPVFVPIRGGTDGSRLTEMGIPTPNIFTGGHNFHSRLEWLSLEQMKNTVYTLLNLAQQWRG